MKLELKDIRRLKVGESEMLVIRSKYNGVDVDKSVIEMIVKELKCKVLLVDSFDDIKVIKKV